MRRKTTLSVEGPSFLINGRPTYTGCWHNGLRIEGLLMNSRMVQGIFDDLNSTTRSRWNYPDGPWDADRNTTEFIAAMPSWRDAGLLSFTINLQGGNPEGYGKHQPWHNSAFHADGTLRMDYMARLEKILDKADELGMAPIVGFFYFGQDCRLRDEEAVLHAAENAARWLLQCGYVNVLVEIGNEVDLGPYSHEIIKADRVHELLQLVQKCSAGKVHSPRGRLLVGASMSGGSVPPDSVIASSDILLLHGNGLSEPDQVRRMVQRCRKSRGYRDQPIVLNEDDHYNFDADDNNMLAAISGYASWGYFDYRRPGEKYDEGFQCVPVNWQISSERKCAFFSLLAKVTGRKA